MKIKEAIISLDFMGKPVIQFEAIPETNLERDALRAIGTALDIEERKDTGQRYALKLGKPMHPDDNRKDSYLIHSFWQVDGGRGNG